MLRAPIKAAAAVAVGAAVGAEALCGLSVQHLKAVAVVAVVAVVAAGAVVLCGLSVKHHHARLRLFVCSSRSCVVWL